MHKVSGTACPAGARASYNNSIRRGSRLTSKIRAKHDDGLSFVSPRESAMLTGGLLVVLVSVAVLAYAALIYCLMLN